jgi:hypothetical protein
MLRSIGFYLLTEYDLDALKLQLEFCCAVYNEAICLSIHFYSAVLWARADSAQALVSDFVAFAELLQLPERNVENQQRIIEAVKHWLQMKEVFTAPTSPHQ